MSEFLKGRSISEVIVEANKEVDDRRKGLTSKGIKTRWEALNGYMGGGFQKGFNYLIAGLSGSGKSTIANILETDIFDYNPGEPLMVLNFNFETPSMMNLIKKYSADVGLTVDELMSVDDNLRDEIYNQIELKSQRYDKYPIYYFDVSGTVDAVENTIIQAHMRHPDKHLFCILDHTALVTPKSAQNELQLVSDLAKMSIRVKKQTNCTFIMLGQLNSEIEQIERLTNPALHAPKRRDLFGGKAVWNAMDCVLMPHRPEILDLNEYTTRKLPAKGHMYFHIRKARYGKIGTIDMDCSKIGQNIITEIGAIE